MMSNKLTRSGRELTKAEAEIRREIYSRLLKVETLLLKIDDAQALAVQEIGELYAFIDEKWLYLREQEREK